MHTGLVKLPLLLATRLSPLGSWLCTELMTRRGWTPKLHSDTSLTIGHCGIEPSVPTICSLDSILRADFFFHSSRKCLRLTVSLPASLGKLLGQACPWDPSCTASGRLFSGQLVGPGYAMAESPEHCTASPWGAGCVTAQDRALAPPIPTSGSKDVCVCYHLLCFSQSCLPSLLV